MIKPKTIFYYKSPKEGMGLLVYIGPIKFATEAFKKMFPNANCIGYYKKCNMYLPRIGFNLMMN